MYNTGLENMIPAQFIVGFVFFIIILVLWSIVWKAIALWMSARNNDKAWFIVMLILNTAGILEIIYIFAVAMKKKNAKKSLKEEIKSGEIIEEEKIEE